MKTFLIIALLLAALLAARAILTAQHCYNATRWALVLHSLEDQAYDCTLTRCSQLDLLVTQAQRLRQVFEYAAQRCIAEPMRGVKYGTAI